MIRPSSCLPLRRVPARTRSRGFTMVEMLTVMSVMIVLLALAVPVVKSLGSNKLSNSGRLFANVLTVARSEAINRRTLMQVRIVTTAWKNSAGTDDATMHYRKFSLWQHKPPADAGTAADPDPYTQVAGWETLAEGIVFEVNAKPEMDTDYPFGSTASNPGTYFLNASLATSLGKTNVPISGGTMDAACIEFTPTGGLNLTSAVPVSTLYFLLVPGVLSASATALAYTSAHHPNWLMVQVTPLTGRIQIIRP